MKILFFISFILILTGIGSLTIQVRADPICPKDSQSNGGTCVCNSKNKFFFRGECVSFRKKI